MTTPSATLPEAPIVDVHGTRFDMLTVFTFMWGVGVVFHMLPLPNERALANLAEILLIFAAFLAIFRPHHLVSLLTLSVVQLIDFVLITPSHPNHWMLVSFVNLTIVAAAVRLLITTRRLDRTQLFREFSAIVRVEVVIFYFYVTFHKLNWAFLNPEVSCGASQYHDLADKFGLPVNRFMDWMAIIGTLLIEGGIPILLTLRRTRLLGFLVATGFHYMLGAYAQFYDFSGFLFALFWLFAPEETPQLIVQRFRPVVDVLVAVYTRFKPAFQVVALVIAWRLFVEIYRPVLDLDYPLERYIPLWWVYGLTLMGVFFASLVRADFTFPAPQTLFQTRARVLYVLPLLILLNGAGPYLGFKSNLSFEMFSNLQIAVGESNHIIVPAAVRLWDYTDDTVRIVEGNTTRMRRYAALTDTRLTWHELRRYVYEFDNPGLQITYERNGERFTVRGDDPAATIGDPAPLLFKLFHFGPVFALPRDEITCTW